MRTCIECSIRIYGRSDKKYCSDSCRSAFNNRFNHSDVRLIRQINKRLLRNRRILRHLMHLDALQISRTELIDIGFNFRYHTHIRKNTEGRLLKFCYDYGYTDIDKDMISLIEDSNDKVCITVSKLLR